MKAMKIGEVARRSGVGVETIRYYERLGLLQTPDRRPSGYRQYGTAVIERLEYIRRSKELGFTLSEIRELLEVSFASQKCCDHIRQRARDKLSDIDQKIRDLQKMRRSLKGILKRCSAQDSDGECPLVHTIEHPT